MDLHYQLEDFEVIDYNLYYLQGISYLLRGPKPPSIEPNSYISYIGAAQTFGTLCQFPYPNLLAERLCIPTLNLGYGGAGPRMFLQNDFFEQDKLFQYINNSKLVVIQVLSGRSVHNSLLDCPFGASIVRRVNEPNAPLLQADSHYQRILEEFEEAKIKDIVQETRINWVGGMIELLQKITVPKILLWFSVRQPEYTETYENVYKLFNNYPQLVNRKMLDQLLPYTSSLVEAVSARGIPQQLYSRFSGQKAAVKRGNKFITKNNYYPSPQMHQDAADLLEPAIKKVL